MDQGQLDALYQQYLGRGVDPSGAASWGGADYNTVVQGILGSQEYQNRQQPQGQGIGPGWTPQAQGMADAIAPSGGGDINSIYQQYLGRGVDPSGAATYAGWDPQSIINAVTSSQEYRNRTGGGSQAVPAMQTQPQGQGIGPGWTPQAQPQQQPYTPGPSYGEYNFEMTGKPSDQELATNSDMANAWYRFSGTSPAPAMTWETAPDTIRYNPAEVSFYKDYGLEKPFSQSDIQSQVDPKSIRYGYGNTPYAAVKSNVPGLETGGEYIVNPQTGRFYLDASGNPIPVPLDPNRGKSGTFDSIMETAIPLFIAAASIPVLGGLGAQALGGIGALGEAGAIGAAEGAALAGEALPYTEAFDAANLFANGITDAGQLGDILASTGMDPFLAFDMGNLAAQGLSAEQIAQVMGYSYNAAELAGTGIQSFVPSAASAATSMLSASQLANLAKGGTTIASLVSKLTNSPSSKTPTSTSPSQLAKLLNPNGSTGSNQMAQSGSGFGLMKGNVNPFTYTKDMPVQTLATNKADPFAALNVAQTPITPYNPLAHLVG
jgi:hypothetical protein